jgi:16S rRNA C967 or C1407 C5-methylase (RsmB/RsmF family)/NOL1/NOP2/fmu family ribosome biogenesis protein
MLQLPVALIDSLKFVKGFNKETFLAVHSDGEQVTSVRINPLKTAISENNTLAGYCNLNFSFPDCQKIPWSQYGYYLKSRPSFTFDPFFHAGCYYVQEASSMFLEQALLQTVDLSAPLKILDLCAAPGGKSTHILSLIAGNSLLVSNDVIRSRSNVLKDNLIKWGDSRVAVTNNDPKDFAILENYFDVIVVDAPCSGSGLFRREPDAIQEWSENNVKLCSQRQQRILADVWPALKNNGILIYSTCSYSKVENEDITDWISLNLPSYNIPVLLKEDWNITETISGNGNKGYRFWPDKLQGEGFFISCFQKKDGGAESQFKVKSKPEIVSQNDMTLLDKWVATENMKFIKYQQTVYAWHEQLFNDFSYILEKLRMIYSGTVCGELMKNKMVPSHALAVSSLLLQPVEKVELDEKQAIAYLQRNDINIVIKNKGWKVVAYKGLPLGWINILQNRVNNYYPKALRILKS